MAFAAATEQQAAVVQEIPVREYKLEKHSTQTTKEAVSLAVLAQVSHSVSLVAGAAYHINREMVNSLRNYPILWLTVFTT